MASQTEKNDKRFTFITWVVGLVGAVLLASIPYAFSMHGEVSSVKTEMKNLGKDISELAETIKEISRDDIQDLKRRMTIMENKGILPEADRRVTQLERQMRDMEKKNN